MSHATVSRDYQVQIPEDVRRAVPLEPGQSVRVVARMGVITVAPERPRHEDQLQPAHSPQRSLSLAELAAAQGVEPVRSFEELCGGWPEDEIDDGFEVAVRRWRDEELETAG